MLSDQFQITYYVSAGPQAKFMHSEQVLDHPTIIAIESGVFQFEIGDTQDQAAFGDIVICPANVMFKREAKSEITFHHIHLKEAEEASPYPPAVKITIGDKVRLASTYSYLRSLYRSQYPAPVKQKLAQQFLIQDLFFLIEMEILRANRLNKKNDLLMEKAIRSINQEAFKEFSLKQLAVRLGLDQSQFTRRFRTAFGEAPIAYLTKVRLEKVKKLLLETDDTLESIAYQCGYESGSYLCRIFTGKVGINPSIYRHNYRI